MFNGDRQLMVPLFQRSYEWNEKNWQTLWEDLLERYEQRDDATNVPHFTGAIVTSPAKSIPIGVSKFLVIDGQQRLTTISLLLCAIRSLLPADSLDRKRITRLLINDLGEGLDRFKLLPTQPDRDAWGAVIDEKPGESRFHRALAFFTKKLGGKDSDEQPFDLPAMLETVKSKLHAVAITLGDADDPYLIFESLNAKGAPLTQADLIRNYILLRLRTQEQERIYDEFWLPMQTRLGDSLTEFMRVYLMQAGADVVKGDIYAALKRKMANVVDNKVADEIAAMNAASVEYAKFLTPDLLEQRPSIRRHLRTLQRWEAATAHPLLLRCFCENAEGRIGTGVLEKILSTVESFIIRRAVCEVPTNQLKKTFLSLVRHVEGAGTADAIESELAAGKLGRRWPKDAEFEESWRTYPIYAASNIERCRVILEALEASAGHKEQASFAQATIEHVMPQTLTEEWHVELGEAFEDVHEKLIDTIGNLTLTGYNSTLSNSPFSTKKTHFADSNFTLNGWFENVARWDEAAILTRADALATKALKLWSRPA